MAFGSSSIFDFCEPDISLPSNFTNIFVQILEKKLKGKCKRHKLTYASPRIRELVRGRNCIVLPLCIVDIEKKISVVGRSYPTYTLHFLFILIYTLNINIYSLYFNIQYKNICAYYHNMRFSVMQTNETIPVRL